MKKQICLFPHGQSIPCGAIVYEKKRSSHFSLVEYNGFDYYIPNDIIDPFFEVGEKVFVNSGEYYVPGKFIHHSGPGYCLVMVGDGIVDERRLSDINKSDI